MSRSSTFCVFPRSPLVGGMFRCAPKSVYKILPLCLLYGRKGKLFAKTDTLAIEAGYKTPRSVEKALKWLDAQPELVYSVHRRRRRVTTHRQVHVFKLGENSNFPIFKSVIDEFRNLSASAVALYLACRALSRAEYETDFDRAAYFDRRTETIPTMPSDSELARLAGFDRHSFLKFKAELEARQLVGEYEDDGSVWVAVRMPPFDDEDAEDE